MSEGLKGKVVSYTAGNLVAQVASTLTGIVLARSLSPHDLGSYRQVLLIITTAGGMLTLGLPLSVFYFVPRLEDDAKRARFIGQTLILLSAVALAASLAVVAISGWLAIRMSNPDLVELFRVAAPLVGTGIVVRVVAPLLLSLERSREAGLWRIAQSIATSIALVGLVVAGMPLTWAFAGMLVAEAISLALAYGLQHRALAPRWSLDSALLRTQFAYAIPLGLSAMVGLLSRKVDEFMVSAYMDPATYGQYSIGAVELPLIPLVVGSVVGVALPQLARRWGEEDAPGYQTLFRRTQRKLSLLAIPTVAFTVAVAEPFLVSLYGENFARSTPVFQIYSLILLNRLFLFGALLQSTGLSRVVLTGEIAFFVLNVVGNWFFLRWIGFVGPALATWLAGVVIMLAYLWRVGRLPRIERTKLYDGGAVLRMVLASALACAATWALAGRLPLTLWALAVEAVAFTAVAVPLLALLRVVQDDEWRMLQFWKRGWWKAVTQ